MRRIALALALVPAALLAACGGDPTVEQAEVERQTRTQLSETVGQQAPPVNCPGDLTGEVGETMRCSMDFTEERRRLGVTIRVTEVDGERVRFDIQADDELKPIPE